MSNNFVFIPKWMKDIDVNNRTNNFDTLINRSPAFITEAIFIKDFLPLFIAPSEEISNESRESYVARYLNYAVQPYNPIDVYERLDEHGNGINLLFTMPPLWNSDAPTLKNDAKKSPVINGEEPSKYDSSIFRTLVARINLLIAAGDTLQLLRYSEAILPNMVEEAPTINKEHLKQWHYIHQRYNIKNELSDALNRLLGNSDVKPGSDITNTESDIKFSDEDDDF